MNYDALNRVTLEQYSDGTTHTYTYDAVHNKLTSASPHGTYTSTFTNRNQVTTVTEPGGKVATHSYDAAGRRTAMNAYGQGEFLYGWDRAGRQTHVTNPHAKTTTLAYDPIGQLLQRYYPNRAVASHTYDGVGNVLSILNTHAGAVISSLTYGYGRARNRTHQREADGTLTNWTYDGIYQLTNELRAGGPAGTSFNFTHTYDGMGNRIAFHDGATLTTYTYSAANRLQLASAAGAVTTYTNDASGNRLQVQDPDSTTYYTWNAVGQMSSAEPPTGAVAFTYNAEGQRASKSDNSGATGFLYDHKNLLQETDGVGGDIDTTYDCTTDQEFGDLLGEFGQDEQYSMYDAQKCANAIVDANGTLLAQYKYQAFGSIAAVQVEGDTWARLTVYQSSNMTLEQWSKLPVSATSAMMTFGQRQCYSDLELGLVYMGMGGNIGRSYDPTTGRFICDDPIRQAGGTNNLGEYVGNNPITHQDPSGHEDPNYGVWGLLSTEDIDPVVRNSTSPDAQYIMQNIAVDIIKQKEIGGGPGHYAQYQQASYDLSYWLKQAKIKGLQLRQKDASGDTLNSLKGQEDTLYHELRIEMPGGQGVSDLSAYWQGLQGAVSEDFQAVKSATVTIGGEVVKGIEAGGEEIFEGLAQLAGVDPASFIDNVKKLNGDLTTIIKACIEDGPQLFKNLNNGVRQGFSDFFGGDGTNASPGIVGQVLGVFGKLMGLDLNKLVSDISTGGWTGAIDVGETVLKAVNLSWDAVLSAMMEEAGSGAAAVIGFVVDLVGDALSDKNGIWDWLKKEIGKAEDWATGLWTTLKGELLPTMAKGIAWFVAGLLAELVPGLGWLEAVYKAITFVVQSVDALGGLVGTFASALTDAASGNLSQIVGAVKDGLGKALEKMIVGLLKELNLYWLPQAIKKSIMKAGSWVYDKLKHLAQILLGPIKKFFAAEELEGETTTPIVEDDDGTRFWLQKFEDGWHLMSSASPSIGLEGEGDDSDVVKAGMEANEAGKKLTADAAAPPPNDSAGTEGSGATADADAAKRALNEYETKILGRAKKAGISDVNTFIVKDKLPEGFLNVFILAKHGDMNRKRPTGFESHHGIWDNWAEANITGYKSKTAPTIFLGKINHDATRAVFNEFLISAPKTGVKVDWKSVSLEMAKTWADKMFADAKVPQDAQDAYYKAFSAAYNIVLPLNSQGK